MSEVKRWKLKGFLPGIEGESKAVFQPTVVLAEDYDAALAREAALREERDALQQRLIDAEKLFDAAVTALNEIAKVSHIGEKPFEIATLAIGEMSALKPAEGEGL